MSKTTIAPGSKPLSPPQYETFARAVAMGKKHRAAAIAAGYQARDASARGSKLAKTAKIRQRIEYLQKQVADASVLKTALTKDWVLERLMECANRAMQGVAVLDEEGNQVGQWRFDGSTATRSLQLLGQHLALFTQRIEEKVEVDLKAQAQVHKQITEFIDMVEAAKTASAMPELPPQEAAAPLPPPTIVKARQVVEQEAETNTESDSSPFIADEEEWQPPFGF
jgi:hypothetical protein